MGDRRTDACRFLGGEIDRITITHLSDSTFFAELTVRKGDGEVIQIDSRPSDAIALGVASDTPIYVAEEVIESATRDIP